jgi:YD repeat-containing protein
VTLPTDSDVNVGELIRAGVVLQPREVVALVHEMCGQAAIAPSDSVPVARADDLWIRESGELTIGKIEQAPAPSDPTDLASSVALLLEELAAQPRHPSDSALPASLRSLPARLRASVEGGARPSPSDLLFILRRHVTDDPRQVLQQLNQRARVVQPGNEPSSADAEMSPDDYGAAVRQAILRDHSRDGLNSFMPEAPPPAARVEPSVVDNVDVFRTEQPPADRQPRRPPRRGAQGLAALALLVASAYAGYKYGHLPERLSQSTARASQVAVPNQQLGATGGPGTQPTAPRQADTDAANAPGNEAPPANVPDRPQRAPMPTADDRDRVVADAAPQPLMLPVADGAFSPSFAPTGRKLLFHSGQRRTGRLLEADLDERGLPSRVSPLLPGSVSEAAAKDYHPRLSPDARLIAFDSDRDGERGVYVSEADGSRPSRVSGSGFAAVPSWSPDMKRLAFVRAEPRRPKVWNLWIRDLASGKLSRQTSYRVGQAWGASWFPDSRHLCYSHEDRLVITDIDSATGDSISFRTPRPGRLVRTPAVSPDGKRVVFQVFRDGVWLLDLRTGSMRRILDDATAEEFAWDPEGRRIAYHSRRDGTWRIWMTTPPPV